MCVSLDSARLCVSDGVCLRPSRRVVTSSLVGSASLALGRQPPDQPLSCGRDWLAVSCCGERKHLAKDAADGPSRIEREDQAWVGENRPAGPN